MANNYMIDIETFGTAPSTVVTAVGIVVFNKERILDTLTVHLDIKEQIEAQRQIDGSTILWWLRQSKEAQNALLSGQSIAKSVMAGLKEIEDLFKTYSPGGVWGNASTFDNVIVSDLFRQARRKQPWDFWNDRCYRTMKNVYPDVKIKTVGVKHDALSDAISQAEHLMEIQKAYPEAKIL